jgi:hypothetical protein
MAQAAVVQYRQVEAAAVPADQLRVSSLDRRKNCCTTSGLAGVVAVHEGVHAQAPSALRNTQLITSTRCR